MVTESPIPAERRQRDPKLEVRYRAGYPKPLAQGRLRSLGLGMITGASDDDPVAVGTYAAPGAAFGPSFLWIAPLAYPMMFAVVYLCSKLGQVAGEGLFAVIRRNYPRWLLYSLLATAVVGNVVEAAADLGGMAAALNVIVPVPIAGMVIILGIAVLVFQTQGYAAIRNVFRWMCLALFAYIISAVLAKPDFAMVLFAAGVVAVGFLAVPVMTMGAAFDVCQSFGWKYGLQAKPREAKPFYWMIIAFTVVAIGMNFFGINPMKALIYVGIVQGVSTPFLMLLVMLITNRRKIMGRWTNSPGMNVLGWLTITAMFGATVGLLITILK